MEVRFHREQVSEFGIKEVDLRETVVEMEKMDESYEFCEKKLRDLARI